MSTEIRILELPAMKVASFLHFSDSPEMTAKQKLLDWAEPKGLLKDRSRNRIFGFNNPNPSPGSPNYGYEFWLQLADGDPEDGAEIKEVEAGKYAVLRCNGIPEIGWKWKELMQWVQNSPYQYGSQECLEEELSELGVPIEEMVLDLYVSLGE